MLIGKIAPLRKPASRAGPGFLKVVNVVFHFATEIWKWRSRPALFYYVNFLVVIKSTKLFPIAFPEHSHIQRERGSMKGPQFPSF
jgi:hypothetical protein